MFGIIKRLARHTRPDLFGQQPAAGAQRGPVARVAATGAPEERPSGPIAKLLDEAAPEDPTAADDTEKARNKRPIIRRVGRRSLLGFGDQING